MLTVINYHYIRQTFEAPYPSIFGVMPEDFQKQLLLLKTIGTFIHPKELVENNDTILQSKKNFILVTFDDGLKEQFEIAKPILEDLGIAALYFVNSINFIEKKVSQVHKIHLLRSQLPPTLIMKAVESDFVLTTDEANRAIFQYQYDDKQSAFLKYILNFKMPIEKRNQIIDQLFGEFFDEKALVDSLYMSTKQLKMLGKAQMLGSHSHSHLALGILPPLQIEEELAIAKLYLETLTETDVNCVSYPFGTKEACADPVAQIAKKTGHSIGFTFESGINKANENKLLLKRFDCNDLIGGKNYKQK